MPQADRTNSTDLIFGVIGVHHAAYTAYDAAREAIADVVPPYDPEAERRWGEACDAEALALTAATTTTPTTIAGTIALASFLHDVLARLMEDPNGIQDDDAEAIKRGLGHLLKGLRALNGAPL